MSNSAILARPYHMERVQWVGYYTEAGKIREYNLFQHQFNNILYNPHQCVKIMGVIWVGLITDTATGTTLSTFKPTAKKHAGFVLLMVSSTISSQKLPHQGLHMTT